MNAIEYARKQESAKCIAGGKGDDKVGWFIRPTVIETTDPDFKLLREELFGPVLTVCVRIDGEDGAEKLLAQQLEIGVGRFDDGGPNEPSDLVIAFASRDAFRALLLACVLDRVHVLCL